MNKYKYITIAFSILFILSCASSDDVSTELQDINFQATVDAGITARLAEIPKSEPTPTPIPVPTIDVQAMIDAAVAKALESVPTPVRPPKPIVTVLPTPTPVSSWEWDSAKDSIIVGKSTVLIGQLSNLTDSSDFASQIEHSENWPLISTGSNVSSRQNNETFRTGWLLKEYPNHILTTANGLTSNPFVDIYITGWTKQNSFRGWIIGRDEDSDLALIKIIDINGLPPNIINSIYLDGIKPIVSTKNVNESSVKDIYEGIGFCLYCEDNNSGWSLIDTELLVSRYKRDTTSGVRYVELSMEDDQYMEDLEEGLGVFDKNYSLIGLTVTKNSLEAKGISISNSDEIVYMMESSTINEHIADLYTGRINTDFKLPPNLNSAAVPPLPSFLQGTIRQNNLFVDLGGNYYIRVVSPNPSLSDIWLNFVVGLNGAYTVTLGLNDSKYIGATVEFYLDGKKSSAVSKFKSDMSITKINLDF